MCACQTDHHQSVYLSIAPWNIRSRFHIFFFVFLFLSQQTTSISFNTKALHNKRNQNGNENEDEDDDEDDLLIRHGFRHFDCHLERRNEGCRINRSTSDCYDVNSVEGIIM